jgi:hypothetical protein
MLVCIVASIRASGRGSGVQQVEVAEQELIEGKLCPLPLLLPNNVLYNYLFMHRHNFDGAQ